MNDSFRQQRIQLVEAVYGATLSGDVIWTGGDDGVPVYETLIDGIPVTIQDEERETSSGTARYVILKVYTEAGSELDSFDDMDVYLDDDVDDRGIYSDMVMNLHEIARRQGKGVDSVFRKIVNFLSR